MIVQYLLIWHDFVGFSSRGILAKVILLIVMFADILENPVTVRSWQTPVQEGRVGLTDNWQMAKILTDNWQIT